MITRQSQRGITLTEVMMSLLLMSLGLLGMASLQGKALSSNQGAYLRSQAAISSYDILDRLRANRSLANQGKYNHDLNGKIPAAAENNMASVDLNDWLTLLKNNLPKGKGAIKCVNQQSCTIQVQWFDVSINTDTNEDGVIDDKDKQLTLQLVSSL